MLGPRNLKNISKFKTQVSDYDRWKSAISNGVLLQRIILPSLKGFFFFFWLTYKYISITVDHGNCPLNSINWKEH